MLSLFRSPAPRGLTAAEAIDLVAEGKITLIDVRDVAELAATGRAEGALHVPLMAIQMKCNPSSPECLSTLSTHKPVAVYCASGGRSQMARQMLMQLGYREVHNIGGLADWHAAGGAITR